MRKFEAQNTSINQEKEKERNLIDEIQFQRFHYRDLKTSGPDSASNPFHLQKKSLDHLEPLGLFGKESPSSLKLKDLFRKGKKEWGKNKSDENPQMAQLSNEKLHCSMNPNRVPAMKRIAGIVCSFVSIHELGSVKVESIKSYLQSEDQSPETVGIEYPNPVKPAFFTLFNLNNYEKGCKPEVLSEQPGIGGFGKDTVEFGTPEIFSRAFSSDEAELSNENESEIQSLDIRKIEMNNTSCFGIINDFETEEKIVNLRPESKNFKNKIDQNQKIKDIKKNSKKKAIEHSKSKNFGNYWFGFILGFFFGLFGLLIVQNSKSKVQVRGAFHGSIFSAVVVYPLIFWVLFLKNSRNFFQSKNWLNKNIFWDNHFI